MKIHFLFLVLAMGLLGSYAFAADREIVGSRNRSLMTNRPVLQQSTPEPAYCKMEPQTPGCSRIKNDQLLSDVNAGKLVAQCPQGCDSVSIIDRETWGAKETVPTCTSSRDMETFKRIDQLKLQRGQAECSKNQSQYTRLNRAIETLNEPSCIPPVSQPKSIVIHHTTDEGFGGVRGVTPKSVQDSHMGDRGWSDIGYHYLIAMDEKGQWQIYEGRKKIDGLPCTFNQGGHGGPGLNSDSLGIAIAGNYEPESKPSWTGPNGDPNIQAGAVQKLAQLVGSLKKECPSITELSGHGDHQAKGYGCSKTQCPGSSCKHIMSGLEGIIK